MRDRTHIRGRAIWQAQAAITEGNLVSPFVIAHGSHAFITPVILTPCRLHPDSIFRSFPPENIAAEPEREFAFTDTCFQSDRKARDVNREPSSAISCRYSDEIKKKLRDALEFHRMRARATRRAALERAWHVDSPEERTLYRGPTNVPPFPPNIGSQQ